MKNLTILTIIFVINLLIISSNISFSIVSSHSLEHPFIPENPIAVTQDTSKIMSILNNITEDLLRSYLEPLVAFSPRYTGTYGCEKSAKFIFQQFDQMGLKTGYQNWTSFGNIYHRRLFTSQNVEATLEGKDDKIVIFNAHYDTVKFAPGANDDGSGTAAVLAAAYVLGQHEFNHTLKFVTFSGEEVGLVGSQVYAKEAYDRSDDIILEINADMIGRATTTETGRRMGISATTDAYWVQDLFEISSNVYDLNMNINKNTIIRDSRGYSDYHSFVEYGYEAVACWEGEGDPNMHTWGDDLSNVNFSYLVNTTKMIVSVMAFLADTNELPPQVRIESPKIGNVYYKDTKICNIGGLTTIVLKGIWIWADVKYSSSKITKAEFYYDGKLVHTDTEPAYNWYCNKISLGNHCIKVIVYDDQGGEYSDWVKLFFINLEE
jgi:aminopeptidase YwaD